jgi:hypothetical protein
VFAVHALLALVLLCSSLARNGEAPTRDNGPAAEPLTLSNEHPSGSFPVSREILASDPTRLAIELTRVVNVAGMPVSFFVYLSDPKHRDRRKLVGNFALYPPDRPGKFLLNPSEALHLYKVQTSSADAQLIIEMKRLHESQPWRPIEVTVAPPGWTRDSQ